MTSNDWIHLTLKPDSRLTKAIACQHHASQFVALVGKYYGEEKRDESHTAMVWNSMNEAYQGFEVDLPPRVRVCLAGSSLELVFQDEDDAIIEKLKLTGVTNGYAFAWVKEQIAMLGADHLKLKKRMHYDLPEHLQIVTIQGFN